MYGGGAERGCGRHVGGKSWEGQGHLELLDSPIEVHRLNDLFAPPFSLDEAMDTQGTNDMEFEILRSMNSHCHCVAHSLSNLMSLWCSCRAC